MNWCSNMFMLKFFPKLRILLNKFGRWKLGCPETEKYEMITFYYSGQDENFDECIWEEYSHQLSRLEILLKNVWMNFTTEIEQSKNGKNLAQLGFKPRTVFLRNSALTIRLLSNCVRTSWSLIHVTFLITWVLTFLFPP